MDTVTDTKDESEPSQTEVFPSGQPKIIFSGRWVALLAGLIIGMIALILRPTTKTMKGKSMAILPFRVGNNAETARIAEVLFDQVHAELASAQSLVVVSKTSSSRFQNSTKSISTIASDLRVSHVMAGSVTREHDNLHPSGTYQSRE